MTRQAAANLYQAVLARRSVRRYETAPLDAATLERVREAVDLAQPLDERNHFTAEVQDVTPATDLVAILGAYGRIVSPPHFLAPAIEGEHQPLVDLGYRAEQVAVRLAGLGIGSCFLGALGREALTKAAFSLPRQARLAALLIFGRPTLGLGGRAVNSLLRLASGATNKLKADQIFYDGTFAATAPPPPELAPLIEAGRSAPSAVDAQPWRFLWRDGCLHLLVKVDNPKYGRGATQNYRLHDGGACMANISLALEALGGRGRWLLPDPGKATIHDHPPELEPLASLRID
jgi:nitroreductase